MIIFHWGANSRVQEYAVIKKIEKNKNCRVFVLSDKNSMILRKYLY